MKPIRSLNKWYWKIGTFEFQYGILSRDLGFWFRKHWYQAFPLNDSSDL